ncbi:MAG: hypothetical protein AB8C02_14100, partial [Halioglobus sp.]
RSGYRRVDWFWLVNRNLGRKSFPSLCCIRGHWSSLGHICIKISNMERDQLSGTSVVGRFEPHLSGLGTSANGEIARIW